MLTFLGEAAVRTLALGLVVGLAFILARRRGGRAELTAWIAVLGTSLAMPLLMLWTPDVTVALPAGVPMPEPAQAGMAVLRDLPALGDVADASMSPEAPAVSTLSWHAVAVAAYLLVAAIMILRLVSGLLLSARLVRGATPLPDSALYGLDIRMSDRITAPLAFASTILVPTDYAAWPEFKRKAVLAHEAGHVTRGDFYVLLASSLNRALFWFSPLAWWLHDRLAVLAENASDAAAIDAVREPVVYAEVLFDFAQRNTRGIAGAIAMARPNTVAGRIERILSGQPLSRRISMKKHLLVFASLLPLVTLSAGLQFTAVREALAAAPAAAGQQRTVEAFHAVSFSSSGTVDIAVGKTQSVSIEASPELLARVTTEVRDGTLYVGRKSDRDNNSWRDDGPLVVHISVPRLDGAKMSGSGKLNIDGLNGGTTAVGISGSGNIVAKGALDKLDLDISGSGRAELTDLAVKNAAVKISGSGNVKINAKDTLEARISGSGDLRYMGSPRITSKVSGSGSINAVD